MPAAWPDHVDEILAGDLTAALAYLTPARGVIISPMAPLGLRDREAGTVTLTSSLGLWRKLDRIRKAPGVAVAYHAREHGLTDRPNYVLVQGRASFDPKPDRDWLESITPQWERFLGPRATGLAGRMTRVYYWERIAITIEVERVLFWADAAATGLPEVFGVDRPGLAPPQSPPKKGTAARVDVAKAASHARRVPHTLLGWCGADGLPEVVPVRAATEAEGGLDLDCPVGLIPPGGRRAGLTSHQFWPRMIGQDQRIQTGWLEAGEGRTRYFPHTKAGYRLPRSKAAFTLGCASLALRMRAARRAGVAL